MNAELKSILTTILAVGLGSVATWLVKSGIITADQTDAFVQGAIGVLLAIAAAGVAYWKSRQHTPAAQVTAIENMSPNVANFAVSALPTEAKAAIKIATLSDADLVNAVVARPDVAKVEVKHDAGPELSAIAESPGQPKVTTQGAKP